MDGFTYYDIFQTKGVEYIVIIFFLFLLIPFWFIVSNRAKIIMKIKDTVSILTADILRIPKGVLFSSNHIWAHLEKSGIAQIGIDDWLLHLVGRAEFNYVKGVGDEIQKGELLAKITNQGRMLDVFSPVSGKILHVNPIIHTGTMGEDPYDEGWMYKIEPSHWKTETASFYFGTEANRWLKKELERFKDFIAVSMEKNFPKAKTPMIVLQEGGELRDHPLTELPGAIWEDFQKVFLTV